MTVGAKLLNLTIELSGAALCTLAILHVLLSRLDRQTRRYFLLFTGGCSCSRYPIWRAC